MASATGAQATGFLNRDEIEARGIVQSAVEAGYRATSYDLHIGNIITAEGKEVDSFELKPQGIVELISRERIKLPPNVVGIVLVKTGMCNRGLLALNIGIIDPGYDGKISSFVVNFSKSERFLEKGEVFLRLMFQSVATPKGFKPPSPVDDESYVRERRKLMAENFDELFLNVAHHAKAAFDAAFWRIFGAVAAFALIIAFATFLLNGATYVFARWWSPDRVTTQWLDTAEQNRELSDRIGELVKQNRELSGRLGDVERRLKATDKREPPEKPQPQ
jgi:dUTPase